jgi:hypothetical protein
LRTLAGGGRRRLSRGGGDGDRDGEDDGASGVDRFAVYHQDRRRALKRRIFHDSTARGVPRYQDGSDDGSRDVFIVSGAEDLVAVADDHGVQREADAEFGGDDEAGL